MKRLMKRVTTVGLTPRAKGGISTCKILPKGDLEFNRFKQLFCPEMIVEISLLFQWVFMVKVVIAELGIFRQGITQVQFISTPFLAGLVFNILAIL